MASGLLIGLFDSDVKDTRISRNVCTHMSTRRNTPEGLNVLSLDIFARNTSVKELAARMFQVVPANHKSGRHITNLNRSFSLSETEK
jgi:hypothetical protein